MIIEKKILFGILIFLNVCYFAQENPYFKIARIKYSGGGDWYNDPSSEVNLLNYINENTNIKTSSEFIVCDLESNDIFNYPVTFLTGHGNVVFSPKDVIKLQEYFDNGGFLYVDDDYGLDNSFRKEIQKIFPNNELIELPYNHDIYNCFYDFSNGPPKIHEHDNKPPRGFGIYLKNRMVLYYTVESNPSDGWANPDIHNDPENQRELALKFGTNVIIYALSN